MFVFFEYTKIVYVILLVWSSILCYSATRFLFVVKTSRSILRKQDIMNSIVSGVFAAFSISSILLYPQVLEHYTSVFGAISIGMTIALLYFTDYLITSIKGLKP